ncbi:MAG: hypothetical protein HZR80_20180 [Candidatus Heimdallarchaeota archaeon]
MHIHQHDNQYNYNEEFLNWLIEKKSKYFDWIITVTFYTSLHKMHSCLHAIGIKNRYIKKHKDLNDYVAEKFPSISAGYVLLYEECRRVRYKQIELNAITEEDLNKYLDLWRNVIKPFVPPASSP